MKVSMKKIKEGEYIQWYWGKAWYKIDTHEVVLFPIPINWVMGWGRNIISLLRIGPNESFYKERYRKGFEGGCNYITKYFMKDNKSVNEVVITYENVMKLKELIDGKN